MGKHRNRDRRNGPDVTGERRDTRTILLTPERAKQWFESRRENRVLKQAALASYVRDMLAGNWKWNGDTMRFNEHGQLMDGQHRCMAVMESGVTIEVLVVGGLPDDRFDTIDRGVPRNVASILALKGLTNATTAVASATILWMYEQTGGLRVRTSTKPSLHEIQATLRKSEREIEASITALRGASMLGKGGRAIWVALHVLLSRVDPALTQQVFLRVLEGIDMKPEHPEFKLNRQLEEVLRSRRKIAMEEIAVKLVKVWNARRAGRSLGVLKWLPDVDVDLPPIV